MTTLMTVGNSEGERRCDEKCYGAKHPDCDCVCGGKNHGVGKAKAMENTQEMAQEMLNRSNIKIPAMQLPLI